MNVNMDPPMESDSMEDHSMHDGVPTEVSEAVDSPTPCTAERSKYPSRSTRNRKPAWMNDYVNIL